MRHSYRNVSQLAKMSLGYENVSQLEKCVTVMKMGHG